MKMMKVFIKYIIFNSLFISVYLNASPVSLDDANNVAINWMQEKTGKVLQIDTSRYKSTAYINRVFTSSAYRIIRLKPKGWVIVSSDDIIKPVIGYGVSKVDIHSIPPAFLSWMHNVEDSILHSINDHRDMKLHTNIQNHIKDEWDRLRTKKNQNSTNTVLKNANDNNYIVKPLLWLGGNDEDSGILWDQGKYYNEKCPGDSNGDDNHVWVGCVATAVGQIMRYHKSPTHGVGSNSYDCSVDNGCEKDYGVQSADFANTTYDWNHMPVKLNDYNDNVSTLLYHVGVGVEMMYGASDGSGAYSYKAENALNNYFGYTASFEYRADYSDAKWHQMIKDALDEHQPLYYAGDGDDGGHAFVLDGYDKDDYYHFNWGWSGYYNGKFTLDDLSPGDYDFTNNQEAIFIIPPDTIHADAGEDQTVMRGESVTLDASGSTDTKGTINKWEWKEGSIILSTKESFTKDDFVTGKHTIVLTITDDNNNSDTDSVVITVKTTLTADAGEDQTVMEGESVTLDASGSTDNSGTINKWEWKEGDTILSTQESFTKDDFSVGVHTIVLTVGDSNDDTDSDTVVITVKKEGGSGGGGALDYLLALFGFIMLFFRQKKAIQ